MKTNVTLNSVDRVIYGHTIKHRTKPDMLSLTDLQKAYNISRKEHGWHERELNDLFNIKRAPVNAESIYYVLKERGLINFDFPKFIELCESQTLIKVLKDLGLYKMYGRGENREVFAHPDVFVLLSLELNPIFYAKTVTWLTDNLVANRIVAGDENNQLMGRLKYNWQPDVSTYQHVNRALNYIVFGKHESNIRNTASNEQLKDLERLQNNFAFAIDCGYVKNEKQLMNKLRDEYIKRHMPNRKK